MNKSGNKGLLRRQCFTTWDPCPERQEDFWCIRWVTDEGIILGDGPFANRTLARAAARKVMREQRYDCRVFLRVLELDR